MRMGLRSLKPVTVSAGEIAERGSFVDLRDVRNPRTDRKHVCVSAHASKFRVKTGGKPRTVYVQSRPELQVFPLDGWRDIGRNNFENRWNAFLERAGGFRKICSPNRKLTPLRRFRINAFHGMHHDTIDGGKNEDMHLSWYLFYSRLSQRNMYLPNLELWVVRFNVSSCHVQCRLKEYQARHALKRLEGAIPWSFRAIITWFVFPAQNLFSKLLDNTPTTPLTARGINVHGRLHAIPHNPSLYNQQAQHHANPEKRLASTMEARPLCHRLRGRRQHSGPRSQDTDVAQKKRREKLLLTLFAVFTAKQLEVLHTYDQRVHTRTLHS